MGRRNNPNSNHQMYSQKVSPFKPMGGGFKQNLNLEATAGDVPSKDSREIAVK